MRNTVLTILAAMCAGGAVVFGITSAADGNTTATGSAAAGQPAAAVQGAAPSQGAAPQGGRPPAGFGTPATGDAADKASAAATAKYDGDVEGVMQLQDGSYVVHVITSSGEYHVLVSKDFVVTGADQSGPGRGALPPSGATAPSAGSGTSS
jgi:hypothetical protein